MLIKLAWRNIWRNSRRSIIVLTSIIVGLVAVVLYDALSVGMIQQMLDNQIGAHTAHIQIHKQGFNDNKLVQNYVPNPRRVAQALANAPGVKAFSERVITFGILSSATNSSGVSLIGIDPGQEARVTTIKKSLVEGRYLSGKMHEIVIGKKLAEKLEVKLGDKVVAMASRVDGSIGSDVFRVVGIFETFSSEFDKTSMYISIGNAREMLGLGQNVSEFAVIVDNLQQISRVKNELLQQLAAEKSASEYEVFTYRELLPLLVMQVDVYRESIIIFYGIVALAMAFGIINTMLMSVFERINEFGVLMAMGMKNRRLFAMILLEAFFLGAIGTLIGFGLSYLLYLPLANSGINLSNFSAGLNSFGVGTVIYPVLTFTGVMNALLVVPVMAILGAIYPAVKAMRLEPISAIRHV